MSYKNYAELIKDNPEAVGCQYGITYLIRPDNGWEISGNTGFYGDGFHGREHCLFSEKMKKCKKTGFIP